jgi:hypothetical protein
MECPLKWILIFCVFALAAVAGPSVALGADTELPAKTESTVTEAEPETEVEADVEVATGTDAAKANLLTLDSKSIDVFVDVLLANDIGGTIDGVYADANTFLLSAIEADIRSVTARNVDIADVLLANGALLGDDAKDLVIASDGKATTTAFRGHATDAAKSVFLTTESALFFRDIVKKSAEGGHRATHFDVRLPGSGLNGNARYLLFVQSSARRVSRMKTAAVGAVIPGIMTFMFDDLVPKSGGLITIALIDKQESKVLWARQRRIGDFEQTQIFTRRMLHAFSRALPAEPEPPVAEPVATTGFKNVREAKIALKAAKISKPLYYRAITDLQHDYRAVMEKLKQRKKSGEISDVAFDILATQATLDYTGG